MRFVTNHKCVPRRRAAPAAEKGSEPAFSVPAARQAPPPIEALAAAAGLTPAAEASEPGPGPVPAAADAGTAIGAAAGAQPAAGQGGADPVGDAAYEEVVGLAEDAADAAKVFAQAIRQQVRFAWHLLQGLARIYLHNCKPCDPAALPCPAGHSGGDGGCRRLCRVSGGSSGARGRWRRDRRVRECLHCRRSGLRCTRAGALLLCAFAKPGCLLSSSGTAFVC